ncbi:MAG TPA: hypothetical protein VFA77_14625 [Candidatus Eisenbacteria bacterium]|jgi:hypothetical protein|nr:hypothetical protein [Candidatus Eisenbacteria bacterium]
MHEILPDSDPPPNLPDALPWSGSTARVISQPIVGRPATAVTIARALVNQPATLLAEEPTGKMVGIGDGAKAQVEAQASRINPIEALRYE